MRMMLFPMIVILSISAASPGVVSGIDTLSGDIGLDWCDIDFDRGTASSPAQLPTTGTATYPCTSAANGIDISFRTYECASCASYCCLYTTSASHPFYRSRDDFLTHDFTLPIDIADQTAFTRIDTLHSSDLIDYPPDTCYWPSEIRNSHYAGPDSQFYVLRTDQGSGVVFRIAPILEVYVLSGGGGEADSIFKQIVVTWYRQTDGSLNFPGINQESIVNPSRPARRSAALLDALGRAVLFDLHGRIVQRAPRRGPAHLPAGVYAQQSIANVNAGLRGFVVALLNPAQKPHASV